MLIWIVLGLIAFVALGLLALLVLVARAYVVATEATELMEEL